MNINGITNSFSNDRFVKIQKLKDNEKSYEVSGFQGMLSIAQNSSKDSLTDKYYNMTDSMSRENKVSFAASIMSNKIINEGMTDEAKSFMKNVASGFSSEEINSLKSEIRSFSASKNANSSDVEKMLQTLDEFVDARKLSGVTPKSQEKTFSNNMDMFYRAALGIDN